MTQGHPMIYSIHFKYSLTDKNSHRTLAYDKWQDFNPYIDICFHSHIYTFINVCDAHTCVQLYACTCMHMYMYIIFMYTHVCSINYTCTFQ